MTTYIPIPQNTPGRIRSNDFSLHNFGQSAIVIISIPDIMARPAWPQKNPMNAK
jgi:hypothetical protein